MNPLHLLWVVPVVSLIGYLFGVLINRTSTSSEKELARICRACWHKWEMGIQQSEPGIRRELDVNITEDA